MNILVKIRRWDDDEYVIVDRNEAIASEEDAIDEARLIWGLLRGVESRGLLYGELVAVVVQDHNGIDRYRIAPSAA